MHSDAYFAKGKLHKTCEDYSMAGRVGENPYGMLADGCSSSPDTDIGARLLVRSLSYELAHNPIDLSNHAELFDSRFAWCHDIRLANTLERAHQVRKILDLPSNCLDATLLHAEVLSGHVHVAVRGDGYIVGCSRSLPHVCEVFQIDHPSNAPEYLNYEANSARYEQYRSEMGIKKTLNIWRDISVANQSNAPYSSAVFEVPTLYQEFPLDMYEIIVLISDGANTFYTRDRTHIPPLAVIRHLTDFKNTAGHFIERRMKRYLKECRKKGIEHDDDLSMAALYLGN